MAFGSIGLVPTSAPADTCLPEQHPALGPACRDPDGSYELDIHRGTGIRVHADGIPAPEAPDTAEHLAAIATDPYCVPAPATDPHMIVIYARPSDRADRYDTKAPEIRELTRVANGRLREEAAEAGAIADYRVRCDGNGALHVANEVLPTPLASSTFTTIINDLKAKGYTQIYRKYWVWFDGSVGAGVGGTGTSYPNESRSVNNPNNGAAGTQPSFAVTFGDVAGASSRVWMHENAHNLGAVQDGAPDSNLAGHCVDGRDVLCYNDGNAPPGTPPYSSTVCTDREHFDCGHDTYFNPDPPSGSYLETSWNLAWIGNRYFRLLATAGFETPSVSATEANGTVRLTVTRRGIIEVDRTVTYATRDVTAQAGVDYTATSGTIRFAPGVRTATIDVPIVSDGEAEPTESFAVDLATTADIALATSTATVSIADSPDAGAETTVQFESTSRIVDEHVGTISFGLRRTGSLTGTSEVQVVPDPDEGIEIATPTVTFDPGESVASVDVTVIDDAASEPTRMTDLTLTAPVGTLIGSANTATVTVRASDLQPDAAIAARASGPWFGPDRYTPTGAGQTLAQRAPAGVRRTFEITVGNDGLGAATVTVRRSATAPGIRLYAFDLATGKNITWSLRRGYRIFLAPGATRRLRINAWVTNEVPVAARRSFWLSANWSGDRWMTDKVVGIIERR